MEKIQDKIRMNSVIFCTDVKSRVDKAVVRCNNQGMLTFNPKMTSLLNMKTWDQVVVGFDKSSQILVLKRAEAEEFGSVKVRVEMCRKGNPERLKNTRAISIGHLFRDFGIEKKKAYRAETNGSLIFLEPAEMS